MIINPFIFRAYDIRGIAEASSKYPVADLTSTAMHFLGLGIGTYIQKHYVKHIAVGGDNRLTTKTLKKAFIQGLVESGCHAEDIGLSTSPLLYYAVCKFGYDGGINITASHNPREYNGLKIVGRAGHSICGEEIQKIRRMISEKNFSKGNGKISTKQIFPNYLSEMKKKIKIKKPLKLVIDAGNGTAGAFAPELFRAWGMEVVELYCDLDGRFPNHPANPEEYENMKELIAKVKETHADIGFGFDGDGDRIGMIDEKGTFYAADYILLLLARDLLSRQAGAKIVYDLKSSLILAENIRKRGGIPLMEKTGHSFIEQAMKREGALLAGEVSGHMFFAENYYGFDDALLAGLKILEILSKSEKPLSEHFTDLPKTCITPEIKVSCPDNKKFAIVQKITKRFQKIYPCITIDGVRIEFENNAWGIIRSSNTSPYLTLRFEAPTPQKLAEIQKIVYEELKHYPEVTGS
ncbi:phosphomannomutase/phosphoglucomutase [Candidatus Peregrinibacteria bacterium]|nr:phosphomannomutase/phosphoglucomutase [Candidatus Peregrinibacteria bacterium]